MIELERSDSITTSVIYDLHARSKRGMDKYNTTLQENNRDNFVNHLYEELLDAAQYCKKLLVQQNEIQDLVKQNPNDAELGKLVRQKYS